MGITDWDAWMKEHHIYIPTAEEARRAIELGQKQVKATSDKARQINRLREEASRKFEEYKKLAADSR